MRVIASYVLKGPLQAILAAAVPAIVSISAPLLLKLLLVYFSGIVIALVTLRLGVKKGLGILLITALAVLLAGQLIQLNIYARLDLWSSIYLWALMWLAASIWQWSQSLPLMLEATALVSISVILVYFIRTDSPIQAHLNFFEPLKLALSQSGSGISAEEANEVVLFAARWLAGTLVAYTTLGAILSLFVARSWQAKLFNPGAWQQEFRTIRLGRSTGILTLLLVVAMLMSGQLGETTQLVLLNVSVVVGLIYIIVGLGIAHALLALKGNTGFWLVGLYALLILLSQLVAPLLMALALTDIWVNYRARIAKK